MGTVTCEKRVDPVTGAVSYVEVPASGNSLTGVLTALANSGPQASTYAGAGLSTAVAAGLAYLPPGTGDVAANAAGAVLSGLSGNLPGAVLGGIAVVSGVLAMVRNESRNLTNDQIKSVVSGLTREQLVGLLDESVAAGNGGATVAGVASSGGVAATVQSAVAHVHV